MKNTIDNLQRYFDNFIDQQNDWQFFLGLAEYKDYLNKSDHLHPILLELLNEREELYAERDKLEKSSVDECLKAMNTLRSIIEENDWKNEGLENLSKEFSDYHEDRIQSSAPLSQNLYHNIVDVIHLLRNKGHVDEMLIFYTPYTDNKKLAKTYTFAPSRKNLDLVNKDIESKKESNLWGVLDDLETCRWAIFEGRDEFNKLAEEKGFCFDLMSMSWILTQVEYLQKQGKPEKPTDFFKKDKFKFSVTRLHNYIIAESEKPLLSKLSSPSKLRYEGGVLYFDDKQILISKSENTTQHSIMLAVTETPNQTADYTDLWSKVFDRDFDKDEWKKIYNPSKEINKKVEAKTGKPNFLIASKTFIKINPAYI